MSRHIRTYCQCVVAPCEHQTPEMQLSQRCCGGRTEVGELLDRRALINEICSGDMSPMYEVKRGREVRGSRPSKRGKERGGKLGISLSALPLLYLRVALPLYCCCSHLQVVRMSMLISLQREDEQMEHHRTLWNYCYNIDYHPNVIEEE